MFMNFVLIAGGCIIGAIMNGYPGAVFGFVIGLLAWEILKLKDRILLLEKGVAAGSLLTQAASPQFAPKDTYVEPESQPDEEIEPVYPQFIQTSATGIPIFPEKKSEIKKVSPSPGSISAEVEKIAQYLKNFFTTGNVVAKVGVIILFFGVAFLLKFAAQRHMFPLEARLISVALGGMVMLAAGWRLRVSRSPYALILQGGAIGILYLDLFAAAKHYEMVPIPLAFALMVGLVVFSGVLAVQQNSISLVCFGAIGGFLAPILMSTGAGNHVALFTFYALLNAGILGIAWFKAWRLLNFLGFVFTFVIGATWGYNNYQPSYFASTEPFLILFFLFYVAISILFAHRQPPNLKGYIDGALVFGVPLAGFAFQHGLVHDFEYGLAFSALALSAFYIGLATLLWNRQVEGLRLLTEAFLAFGVVFGSLAIPLALDGRWTSAVWAIEGGALVWVGLRQHRVLARNFGLLVQLGAGLAFRLSFSDSARDLPVFNGIFLGFVLISLSALSSSYMYQLYRERLPAWEKNIHIPLLAWGLLLWFSGGFNEINFHVSSDHRVNAILLFISSSSAAMAWIAGCFSWSAIVYPPIGLLPVLTFMSLTYFVDTAHAHPFKGWGIIAWGVAFMVQYGLLRHFEEKWQLKIVILWHQATLWLFALIFSLELSWVIQWSINGASTWKFISWAIIPALLVLMILKHGERVSWPCRRFLKEYLETGLAPLVIFLLLWFLLACRQQGAAAPLTYLPLLNPLDLSQLFALLAIANWFLYARNREISFMSALPADIMYYILAGLSFIWLSAMIARAVHFFWNVAFTWYALYNSILFQAAISITWTLTALFVTVLATRKSLRQVWFAGAVLLSMVVLKLFLVDLASTGTVARIVSFLAVGTLMLIIGYYSPLPSRRAEEQT